jgi:hypothetical protein
VSASFEYMVELGNVLNKDIWISVPSTANVDFIRNLARYVKENFASNTSSIYLEQSSDKNFKGNNRTLELQLIRLWNAVNDTRVKHVLGCSFRAFFNNPPQYNISDYAHFDYYAVSGGIGSNIAYGSQLYDPSLSANYTTKDILDAIRQQIFVDDIDLNYMIQIAATVVRKPLIAYDMGFRGIFNTEQNSYFPFSLYCRLVIFF